ncbi:hydroxyacylglutathione hydrolase [Paraburkholderia phenoliruptrix]|uniref:Hydroxyacylglutathione hydrolase n=2 Tax=Paraburkholderia phenoliruptrix TaxID=252970 RepID=K0E1M1_9BURK|nr:hydroxyacylglutathione hydrolase [Paraburkholderia phenoliruptrix]AFT90323.1 Hydroxyacylglutathione hydrolase [Paraburkholderia phenoliruptrix BR3459a]CAB4051742.1 Hydroxyacylglutathione hydrolase GloB [Paraburkholderia phenoliruptrix]
MASSLKYVPVPFHDDNFAWVVTDGTHAIVVDPGDAEPVVRYCRARRLAVSAVLLTHHHGDHTGGVEELLLSCGLPHSPVYGPGHEHIECTTVGVYGGQRIQFSEPAFEALVIATPGHTRGHVAYLQPPSNRQPGHLFSGDTLFSAGCGRLLEGSAAELLQSLDEISMLPPSTLLHCGHEYTLSNLQFARVCEPGNPAIKQWQAKATALRLMGKPTLPTTIGHELAVNPFLRVHQREILDVLLRRFRVPIPHRLAAFILLRAWKDVFQDEFREITERWAPELLN